MTVIRRFVAWCRRFVAGWLPPTAVPVAAVGLAAALLLPTRAWVAVVLLSQAGAYLIGRAEVRRADEAVIAARIADAVRPLALQLAQLEREAAERGEADHEAIRNPSRSHADLVNPAYRSSRGTYDSPVRSGAGLPPQGVSVE